MNFIKNQHFITKNLPLNKIINFFYDIFPQKFIEINSKIFQCFFMLKNKDIYILYEDLINKTYNFYNIDTFIINNFENLSNMLFTRYFLRFWWN